MKSSRLHLIFFLCLPCVCPHPCNFPRQFFSDECIFSEKTHQFWCISSKTDEAISCPTTCTTAGGNDPGQACVFPFLFKGANRSNCLPSTRPDHHGRSFCATTANFDRDGRWTFCENSCIGFRFMLGILIFESLVIVCLALFLLMLRICLLYHDLRWKQKSISRSMANCAETPLLFGQDGATGIACAAPITGSPATSEMTLTTQVSLSSQTDQDDGKRYRGLPDIISTEDRNAQRSERSDSTGYQTQRSYEPLLENEE